MYIGCKQIVKAMQIAGKEGVRVPEVLFTGCCETALGLLDFIAQEFVMTQTVEDIVRAPSPDWNRIESEVSAKLRLTPSDRLLDSKPMQVFESLEHYLHYFRDLVPRSLHSVREEPSRVLLRVFHQDIERFRQGALEKDLH